MLDINELNEDQKSNLIYKAGELRIDTMRCRVFWQDSQLELPDLSYQLLVTLVSRWPEVVSQEELIRTVWQNVQVQNSTLGQRVKLLRQSLQQIGCDASCIGLVRGKGYRFEIDVTEEVQPKALSPKKRVSPSIFTKLIVPSLIAVSIFTVTVLGYRVFLQPSHQESSGIEDTLTVALLPFTEDASFSSDEEYIVRGFNRELTNLFKELTGIRVVQPDNHLVNEMKNSNVADIGQKLNAGFLLTGNIQRKPDGFFVDVELQSIKNNVAVWSETFRVKERELYHLKYDIGTKLLAQFSTFEQHQQFVLRTSPNLLNPMAYDLYLKAMDYHQRQNIQDNQHALKLLEEAYLISPSCAAISAGYAEVLHKGVELGTVGNEQLPFARELSNEIASLYPQLALGYQLLAHNAFVSNDLSLAEKLYLKALKMDREDVDSLMGLSKVYLEMNQLSQAEKHIKQIQFLAPYSTQSLLLRSKLLLLQGDIPKATEAYLAVLHVEPDNAEAASALSQLDIARNE